MAGEPLIVAAVAYTSNVVSIWGSSKVFRESETPNEQRDLVLFSNYGPGVDLLIADHNDIAWNTNLAYECAVRQTGGRCIALAQRRGRHGRR